MTHLTEKGALINLAYSACHLTPLTWTSSRVNDCESSLQTQKPTSHSWNGSLVILRLWETFPFFLLSELCDHRGYGRLVWHSSHIGQTTHRTVTWRKDCCWAKVVCVWSRADRIWTGRVSFRGILFMILWTRGRRVRAWSWNVSSFRLKWDILLLSNRLLRHWCCDFTPTPLDVHDGMWN